MAVGNNLLLWHDSQALKRTAVERDSISHGLLSSFSLSEPECIFKSTALHAVNCSDSALLGRNPLLVCLSVRTMDHCHFD